MFAKFVSFKSERKCSFQGTVSEHPSASELIPMLASPTSFAAKGTDRLKSKDRVQFRAKSNGATANGVL